ncbi:MAG TPA: hypothetical protein VFJ89_06205 [Nocardioides sp.]|nr:hypothetical protein [Nocardioides sp.]
MPPPAGPRTPALVEITCDGVLPRADREEFDGWDVRVSRRTTVLTGRGVDQAALHGALDRLARLGLHVVEVRRAPRESGR